MAAQEQSFFLQWQRCGNPLIQLMTGAQGTQQVLNFIAAKGTEGVVRTSMFA